MGQTRKTTFDLQKVFELKKAIVSAPSIRAFVGVKLRRELFEDFVTAMRRRLPGKKPARAVIRESLFCLVGVKLTDQILEANAWRIAGNRARLLAGHAVPPWSSQIMNEYVPVEITECSKQTLRGRIGVELAFKVLAGTPATMTIHKFWTRKYCHHLATQIGFSKSWGNYPLRDLRELFGFRMYVLIECELSGTSPDFDEIWTKERGDKRTLHPGSCFDWNRTTLKMRRREPGVFDCPMNFPASHRCYTCHVGTDRCVASTHPVTFVREHCDGCGGTAWFDPSSRQSLCIDCVRIQQTTMRN